VSALNAQPATPRAPARSRTLTSAVILLAMLPMVLPFPFALIALQRIYPVFQEQLSQCVSLDCQGQIGTHWEHLGWLLVLGPSLLVAVASILLGTIGFIRARWYPTLPEHKVLFAASVACGVLWASLYGCLVWALFQVYV
jgi:hypothetical protein